MKNSNFKSDWEKTVNISLFFLETVLALGSYLIYYYSQRRMGFMRYIVYLNRKIDSFFSATMFPQIITLLLLIIIMYQLYILIKNRKKVPRIVPAAVLLLLETLTLFTARKILFPGIQNSILLIAFTLILIVEAVRVLVKKGQLKS